MTEGWSKNLVDSQTMIEGKDSRAADRQHAAEAREAQDTKKLQASTLNHGSHPPAVEDASHYEQTHVHAVYEAIADHFSATRYAPWPLVTQFLSAQPAGAIGLDVGCGNGKYLSGASGAPPNPSDAKGTDSAYPQLFILGSDRSEALARLAYAKHAHHQVGADVLLADSLALPFRDQCADFIICIAVVHHLSTRERRQAAVKELLRCVRRPRRQDKVSNEETIQDTQSQSTIAANADSPILSTPSDLPISSSSTSSPPLNGRVLLYVWALEQVSSRRGWDAGGDQDLLVPWVKTMKDKSKVGEGRGKRQDKEKDVKKQNGRRDSEKTPDEGQTKQPHVPSTFHRYYHLYKQGELDDDVAAAGGRVVSSGYEKDNWWVVADTL
ncbi:tRNA methyltransferase, has a role in tRNA modification [Sporothrix epigloea]|uniref:tRNA methyltransferase, has a role in tRNA modification n=1 Tax=Sporothrix epigloea TaxID=1892477 RepID=A0ABP0DLB6_9PEZI